VTGIVTSGVDVAVTDTPAPRERYADDLCICVDRHY